MFNEYSCSAQWAAREHLTFTSAPLTHCGPGSQATAAPARHINDVWSILMYLDSLIVYSLSLSLSLSLLIAHCYKISNSHHTFVMAFDRRTRIYGTVKVSSEPSLFSAVWAFLHSLRKTRCSRDLVCLFDLSIRLSPTWDKMHAALITFECLSSTLTLQAALIVNNIPFSCVHLIEIYHHRKCFMVSYRIRDDHRR